MGFLRFPRTRELFAAMQLKKLALGRQWPVSARKYTFYCFKTISYIFIASQ
jgi:hypothetical protein